MFTSILKELLGIKIAECNEIYVAKHYLMMNINVASQKELGSISGIINFHTRHYI